MIFLWIAALCLLALTIWLLIDPVRVVLRAPDHGDPFVLKIRHSSFSFDAWLGSDFSYGVVGHVIGLPFDTNTILAAIRWWRTRPEKKRSEQEIAKPRKPRRPWGKIALSNAPRLKKIARVDVLSIELDYGTGDPVSTGLVSGALWQIVSLLPEHAHLDAQAHFTESVFHIEGEARLSIFPWRVIVAGLFLAVGGLTWRTRTEKAATSYPEPRADRSRIAAPAAPPSPSSRS